MSYDLQNPPATEKDGLINQVKTIANKYELLVGPCPRGQLEAEIACLFSALIDDLSPKRVKFCWMTKNARKKSEQSMIDGVRRFAYENPEQCD